MVVSPVTNITVVPAAQGTDGYRSCSENCSPVPRRHVVVMVKERRHTALDGYVDMMMMMMMMMTMM